ncbi:MAG: hypothetical protein IPM02_28380 [Betaproteobacteria bacterium]|nr:hypothetical protein [Betaproteobacteria bacterium]
MQLPELGEFNRELVSTGRCRFIAPWLHPRNTAFTLPDWPSGQKARSEKPCKRCKLGIFAASRQISP